MIRNVAASKRRPYLRPDFLRPAGWETEIITEIDDLDKLMAQSVATRVFTDR